MLCAAADDTFRSLTSSTAAFPLPPQMLSIVQGRTLCTYNIGHILSGLYVCVIVSWERMLLYTGPVGPTPTRQAVVHA